MEIILDREISALAEAARSGDIRAFERLVKTYMKKAYFFTLGLVGNRDDALDISQNAFVKAHRGIKTLKNCERFPAWFYSILRHEAANYIKKAKRARRKTLADPACMAHIVNIEGINPDRAERCRTVWKAIRELPVEMQEIIVMQHFQELNYNEIAALLDIPRGSVASRLYRARAALKQKLDGLIQEGE
ncbi:MAG TPA: sigma-70 family RNA polymerase sigma factor [archaeon]|nr:sigma-70 family RNA polymerase sigma factor [archaeon]